MRKPLMIASGVLGGGAATPYFKTVLTIQPTNLIQYLRLNETSGTTAYDLSNEGNNGTYTAGMKINNAASPDGDVCPLFDASGYTTPYSAGLNTDTGNKQELTIAIWMKVAAAGVWTDGTQRIIANLYTDNNNRMVFEKSATNNRISYYYAAGGTTNQVNLASSAPTGWTHLCITASKAADQVMCYINGAQTGTTLTGLGTWAGNLLAIRTNIGSFDQVPANPFSGWLAHWAVWKAALTPAEVLQLATINP